uniref:Uncharacterized protein n=1 Tax=Arundo donax TaxID=35708 RepID=A0A0A9HB32_ARUDO
MTVVMDRLSLRAMLTPCNLPPWVQCLGTS